MKENIPPEERLLRLIRGERKPKAQNPGLRPERGAETGVAKLSLPAAKISLSHFAGLKTRLSYSGWKKIIVFIYFVSFAYFLAAFIYPWWGLRKIALPDAPQVQAGQIKAEPAKEVRPLQFYLRDIKSRAIFSSSPAVEQAAAVSGVNVDSIKDIKVVGIISGEKIQAVIEDAKSNKTYSVTKGQIIGEMQIEDITEGKVTIRYQGKLFEFSL